MYYIKDEDNKIVLFDEDINKLKNTIKFMPQFKDFEILKTNENETIFEINGEYQLITESEKEEKLKEIEQDKIDNLTVTALDFINFLKRYGLTSEMIENYLNSNLEAKHRLTFCQNVYCKAVKAFMPLITGDVIVTEDMVEEFFKSMSRSRLG